MKCGGQWLDRAFRLALKHSWEILVKFDPDTRFWRRFSHFPTADWFGWIQDRQADGLGTYIHGGCTGFRRNVIEKTVGSGILWDPVYCQFPYGYQRFGSYRWSYEGQTDEMVAYCDLITGNIAKRLSWTLDHWAEIWFNTRLIPTSSQIKDVAASHPHPLLPMLHYDIPHFSNSALVQEALMVAIAFEKAFQSMKISTDDFPDWRIASLLHHHNFPKLKDTFLTELRKILPNICVALGLPEQNSSNIELQMISYGHNEYYKMHQDNSTEWCASREISF